MKSFVAYQRFNTLTAIIILLMGSIAFYGVLQYVLIRQLDESLKAEQQEVSAYVQQYHQLPVIQNTKNQWIIVDSSVIALPKHKFRTITAFNKAEQEMREIRQLQFHLQVGNRHYLVKVNKSQAETEDLLQLIAILAFGMIALLLVLNFFVNRKLVNKLFKPFQQTITAIREYKIGQSQPLQLPGSPITEIHLLNGSLNEMSQRIYTEYRSLKSFTENAAHEMQTPLAVIRSSIESMIQQNNLDELGVQQLMAIDDNMQKLIKLHQSLLLLAKIENNQFALNETVHLDQIIRNKCEEKAAFIEARQLTIQRQLVPVTVLFHQQLTEILINNLLNNAIRYTAQNGQIAIVLTANSFTIRNTATQGSLDTEKVFKRFYRPQQQTEGTGLGLAIVHEICRLAEWHIQYTFEQNEHCFIIQFVNQEEKI